MFSTGAGVRQTAVISLLLFAADTGNLICKLEAFVHAVFDSAHYMLVV